MHLSLIEPFIFFGCSYGYVNLRFPKEKHTKGKNEYLGMDNRFIPKGVIYEHRENLDHNQI